MKNTEQNKNQRPKNSLQNKSGSIDSRGGNSQEGQKQNFNEEDAGGTGLGHKKDQGKTQEKELKK